MNNLQTLTNEIKHREKSIILNFVDIGRALNQIQTEQLYKEEYADMISYIDKEFSFSHSQGFKFMKVAKEFPSLDGGSPVTGILGIEKLYLLTFVDDVERKEILETASQDHHVTIQDIKQKTRRINVEEPKTDDEEEIFAKYNRIGMILLEEIQDFKREYDNASLLLKGKCREWYNKTEKYQQFDVIRDKVTKEIQSI